MTLTQLGGELGRPTARPRPGYGPIDRNPAVLPGMLRTDGQRRRLDSYWSWRARTYGNRLAWQALPPCHMGLGTRRSDYPRSIGAA
jgi:hypothetical protein